MQITFQEIKEEDFGAFRQDVKDIFSIAVIREFGNPERGEVIPDEDIDEALFHPQAEVYYILADGEKIGGVTLRNDKESHRNSVDLFYIYPDCHGRGLGTQVWQAIEQLYPDTAVWELVTPYFEKRNIHFYLNKCGFRIVEFFCKYHKDSSRHSGGLDYQDEYFRFEKQMNI